MIQIDVLKSFRQRFGLSQQEAATMLSTTRSQIKLAEKGVRPIPIDVGIRLLELVQQVDAGKNDRQPQLHITGAAERQSSMLLSELKDELIITRSQLTATHAQLIRLQQEQEVLSACTQKRGELIDVLQQQKVDTAFLNWGSNDIKRKLSGCHADKKLRLQLQRDLLLAKANVISQYLGTGE
ncbi:helix-turn-helix transcriptional regulator [Ferruginibacter sp. HRS2-29]|uniref:helix-turn-helix domain-containing protein n=1 Tax=Ferruginibacter sp. HRS2-29 TaxID=2487334 RepID=UPI0020CD5356|nr:helix-turn-helix domain-containing protein [Ferruginibacter sp. HRS2-29]MCP9750688.1 helix-turn-helix domain-containing protein [Ferruginibacter sp. HRS2-29]MCP9751552.1 helix-turn-helix domain-containing protein [Ferruginibacter sp. HRS2-29]MCP9752655.1 helix-turn-helix domain-containing protein [Ferruginibacter sp. HRS2-29]